MWQLRRFTRFGLQHSRPTVKPLALLLQRVPMAEVSTGKFGFVVLIEVEDEVRYETECFVVAQEERWAVIVLPAAEDGQSDQSWQRPATGAASGSASVEKHASDALETWLPVSSLSKAFKVKKVEASAVRAVAQTRAVKLRFDPRPSASVLLSAFYQSDLAKSDVGTMRACSTDDGGKSARFLEQENRRLARELERVRRANRGLLGGTSERGRDASPKKGRFNIGSVCSDEENGDESASEGSGDRGPEDPVVRLLQKFDYPREPQVEVPPLPRGRRPDAHEETSRRDTESRGARSPAGRHRDSRSHDVLALQVQTEMLKLLKELREGQRTNGDRDDAPPGNELDGLRVLRNLGRMRALKEHIIADPDAVYREYKSFWLRELGQEGRAFRWTDSHKAIRWQKFTSMKRADWMLCHVLETLDTGNPALARAQVIQCLKATRDFASTGNWKAAWPLTHMPDPLKRQRHGGMEVETEVILGWLRTEDDIDQRIRKVGYGKKTNELVSDHEEGEGEEHAAPKVEKGEKGPKKPNGQRK